MLEEQEVIHLIFLPVEVILTFRNAIVLIKSFVNKNKNEYFCNIFLEKGLFV